MASLYKPTVTTYQLLTSRPSREHGFPHLDLFERREWGLVIYDEVHLLPAPMGSETRSKVLWPSHRATRSRPRPTTLRRSFTTPPG